MLAITTDDQKYSQVALSNAFWYRTGALIIIITALKGLG